MSFAGFELDTIRIEARLPSNKLTKGRTLISELFKRKKVTLREMQSVIGFLNFACAVIVPGRPFLRGLIDLTRDYQAPLAYSFK